MDEPFGALDADTGTTLRRHSTDLESTPQNHRLRHPQCPRSGLSRDRVILFSPHPGRIREEFAIPLPRPRDINSVDLARFATEIMGVLKGYVQSEVAG